MDLCLEVVGTQAARELPRDGRALGAEVPADRVSGSLTSRGPGHDLSVGETGYPQLFLSALVVFFFEI